MKCCIVSGGDFMEFAIKRENYFVIGVDRGYDYAIRNRIIPDLVVGDMDSIIDKNLYATNLEVFPTEKDDTDTAIAVKTALNNGFKTIEIYCALGGRIDHSLGNIQLLKLIKNGGAEGALFSNSTRIRLVSDDFLAINNFDGYKVFSVLALDNECVVSIENAKYPLVNKELTNNYPLGISNEYLENTNAIITSHKGNILVIESKIM